MDLNELALKYNTDKSSKSHNYMNIYESYFSKLRLTTNKILEIGIFRGGSLKVWEDYFCNSEIYGVDINKNCLKYETEHVHPLIGSQNDPEFLHKVGQKYGPFDIIIDDGSHKSKDIIISLENMLEYVVPSGFYVVEDLLVSFVPSFVEDSEISAAQYLSNIASDVNFHRSPKYDRRLAKNLRTDYRQVLESIHFYSQMCFLIKKSKPLQLKAAKG